MLDSPTRPTWETRFWSKISRGGPDECWPWMKGRNDQGYGIIRISGRNHRAHRKSLELKLGRPIRPGAQVLHSCDNPPCCNPAHLREGTQPENMQDMQVRGRRVNRNTKLDPQQVAALIAAPGTQEQVARQFGVSQSNVSMIRSGARRGR